MPSQSKEQHDAMEAAKAGKSTLGIPAEVGAEYVAADKKAGQYTHGGSGHRHMTSKVRTHKC